MREGLAPLICADQDKKIVILTLLCWIAWLIGSRKLQIYCSSTTQSALSTANAIFLNDHDKPLHWLSWLLYCEAIGFWGWIPNLQLPADSIFSHQNRIAEILSPQKMSRNQNHTIFWNKMLLKYTDGQWWVLEKHWQKFSHFGNEVSLCSMTDQDDHDRVIHYSKINLCIVNICWKSYLAEPVTLHSPDVLSSRIGSGSWGCCGWMFSWPSCQRHTMLKACQGMRRHRWV